MTGACRGRLAAALLASAVVLALSACGGQDKPLLAANASVVELAMRDYRFAYGGSIPAGRVVFRAQNVGRRPHELVLSRAATAKGVPSTSPTSLAPLDQLRRGPHPIGYLAPRAPGVAGTFAVDLTPGRYVLSCYFVDPDGKSHMAKGMRTRLVVR